MAGSAENTTADQKPAKKLSKPGKQQQELWWANPCGQPGGANRNVQPITSSEEIEVIEMKSDAALPEAWVIQLRNAIVHIKTIEKRYKEVSS
jgi:hypothetical protein